MDAVFTEVVPEDGLEVRTTVLFSERDGKTTLDVHQVYSHEDDAVKGAPQGWKLTLDQLAEHVRAQP